MTSEEFATALLMLKLTQAELAKQIGLSSKQVNNIVHGRQVIQKQTALAVECLLRRAKQWNSFKQRTTEMNKHRYLVVDSADSDCMSVGRATTEDEAVEVMKQWKKEHEDYSEGEVKYNAYFSHEIKPSYDPDIQAKEEAEEIEKDGAFVVELYRKGEK
ncbi:helix-turn-helix domain-containing protein [Zooshikella marina]|uniref:helix-turn-helix domain-containing protein n=1 Tax=Zooshikella ganghwensis TaxID=202772 RepID=UPI001BAFAEFF|nr:helix-turn-helix domain-containing protein [Zooshikella ganghwensis]MBU2708894.1 helix-turn-helix domain-containing protein [Zooshikella ganghwensis]